VSLRELRKVTGMSTTHLWSIEHDRHSPRLESLAALSRAFKQPLHRFLCPLG
jgi:transcriptional regulator with XRE-family HTH domain